MSVCTFFGHHDCPASVKPRLREVLVDLIAQRGVEAFYVGSSGAFDAMVRACLRELVGQYPRLRYAVVLAQMPGPQNPDFPEDFSDTLLPEGIESVPPRFAIVWRNRWMLQRSQYVVAYVRHAWGGAAQFVERAEKQGKTVIKI